MEQADKFFEMFSLNKEQTRLMFSAQKMLTLFDIDATREAAKKKIKMKVSILSTI